MAGRLAGRAAVVTGGSGGIGSATLRRFVAEGGRVRVPDGPGLGLEIDEALIERFSVEG